MSTPAPTPKKPKSGPGGHRRIDENTYLRMVDFYRRHEGEKNVHTRCATAIGVSIPSAVKAYNVGLSANPKTAVPIKDLLADERNQQKAISTVLLAARTAGADSPEVSEADRTALAQTLGPTDFDQVRAEVRRAVRSEMEITEAMRAGSLRILRASEKLTKVFEDRVAALCEKFGSKIGEDGKVVLPSVSDDLSQEIKDLDVILRAQSKAAGMGRLAIEVERLRIGDPDALRRRLDSVYGSELGPSPTDAPKAEGADSAGAAEDDPILPNEELHATEEWLGGLGGLRVIDGGLSQRANTQARYTTGETPAEGETAGGEDGLGDMIAEEGEGA